MAFLPATSVCTHHPHCGWWSRPAGKVFLEPKVEIVKILLSGAAGLIGRTLLSDFLDRGYQVTVLKRCGTKQAPPGLPAIDWDPPNTPLQFPFSTEPFDVVVHLAGENISSGRWSSRQKMKILKSRVEGTRSLVDGLRSAAKPPSLFLCASAIGYYGNQGDSPLTENAHQGYGFLSEVCSAWEAEAFRIKQSETRLLMLRFGVVLSPRGGALRQMLKAFQRGLGGKLGSGQQYLSWIALEEIPWVIDHILTTERLSGPVNLVSPHPVRNVELTRVMGRVLHRPVFVSIPAFLLRLAMGQMADELLLASTRVLPEKLLASGYQFRFADLETTLHQQIYGD
jgi:hypothetical protein